MASKTFPVRVLDGGRLVTAFSTDNIGANNWTRKLNMRRIDDQEARREGWQRFVGSTNFVFDSTESVLRLAELVRPNGDRVWTGASRTKLNKYNTGTGLWSDIRGGLTFSASGKRWQSATINGYLALNNTVDLPVSYRVEDAAVTPIYEMRQVGIASVGRIKEYNGFLELADITEIKADQLDTWMNGYSSYTVSATQTKNANFSIVLGDHRNQFDVTTAAATITATLPTLTFSQRMYFWIKKVDAGAGTVVTSPTIADELVVLSSNTDIALVWWNGTKWAARVFPLGVIPATDPYGIPPTAITQRLPTYVSNSEFSEPTKWAPLFSAPMAAAGTVIYVPFVPSTWIAGKTRVAVINGGPSGATLGGQTGYEDGVLITAIGAFSPANMGVPITLEVTTDVVITYPRIVQVTRWTDISTIVARYNLQGDGSAIIGLETLGDLLIVARTTGFYIGRYTGDATNPFVFRPAYNGPNVPQWGDCIANVNGDYILYPSVQGRFYKFDGVSWPDIHPPCDDARNLFFNGVVTTDECFAVDNPMTREWWFCTPELTFCFDYERGTVSEMDAVVGAAAFGQKPGSTDQWFILAIGINVFTYGLVTGATPIHTWIRPQLWEPRAASAANNWAAVAWSSTLGLFAAVSTSGTGTRVMTSPDGVTWTTRVSAADYSWNGIAWGAGLFVAVTSGGTTDRVMTSPDGITWTLRVTPNRSLQAVTFGGGQFVAVGSTTAITSPDGITWTDRTQATAFVRSIAYGASRFVAVSSLGDVTRSTDGITWTVGTIPAHAWLGITWSEELDLFVAVGNGVATSPDGITWTDRTLPEANTFSAVAWGAGAGMFVAVASTGTNRVMSSTDGITWTAQPPAEPNTWNAVAWSPSLEIFAAVGSSGTNRVMTSDGDLAPGAILKSGLIDAKDPSNEKMMLSYCPILASASPDVAFDVQILSTYNPSAAPVALLSPVEALPTPSGECFFTLAYAAIYFQDMITLTDDRDLDFRIVERILELDRVGTGGGIPRRVT